MKAFDMKMVRLFIIALLAAACGNHARAIAQELKLTKDNVLETQGLSVLIYQSVFHPVFFDQKLGGIEIIQHDERIATDGEIRLLPTPEQWDSVPRFKEEHAGPLPDQVIAISGYPDQGLSYALEVTAEPGGFRIAVNLDRPLPDALAGKAGFNLDFLPTSYFGKSFSFDGKPGMFPRHPNGPMLRDASGRAEPVPLATGEKAVLSPEDPMTRIAIASDHGAIMLLDGRDRAQNGWFVLRTLIPAGATENAIVWHVRPNVIPGWTRPPVVSYNQVGYTPNRSKVAVIELDPLYNPPRSASVLKIADDGSEPKVVYTAPIKPWGKWLRYQYATFDFSSVREPGAYFIEYAGRRNSPFLIGPDVYRHGVWQPSLDTYLAVQMDHVKVREGYRVWHGASHMDDARQAPTSYTHFDGYSMPATSDSPFAAGEHIPGINVGGWYDAGDYDLRTQTQVRVIQDLVLGREAFNDDWDDTTIDETARSVEIRRPDGVPDAVQQVKHGILLLMAEYKTFGHAIPGIVEPTLDEYTHLGDAASKTDGKIYNPKLGRLETSGNESGVPDDRWAFTTHTTALNYGAAAAFSAASRVLRGYDEGLAAECLEAAKALWTYEQTHPVAGFRSFNTTGGDPEIEEVAATIQMVVTTKGGEPYKSRLAALAPFIAQHFDFLGADAAAAIPFMDPAFKASLREQAIKYKVTVDAAMAQNPFGVPIRRGAWGGSAGVTNFATRMYFLHQAFPDVIGDEYTLRGFDYALGRHPVDNYSLVASVGAVSKLIGYGNNRADYTFIPGAMAPGPVVIPPDFPELKEAWPFLWYENEYVVNAATSFYLAAHAAQQVTSAETR